MNIDQFYNHPKLTRDVRAHFQDLFVKWFRDLRKGKTFEELGRQLDLSRQRIHCLSRLTNLPSPETAKRLSEVLPGIEPLEFQLKAGTIPVELLYTLGWQHYDKFKKFLQEL